MSVRVRVRVGVRVRVRARARVRVRVSVRTCPDTTQRGMRGHNAARGAGVRWLAPRSCAGVGC